MVIAGKVIERRINKLARLLSSSGANVVFSREGIRRGNILIARGGALTKEICDQSPGGERGLLIHAKDKKPEDFRQALEDTLSGRGLLLANLNLRGIEASYDFRSVLLIPPYGGRADKMTAPPKGVYRLAYWLLRKTTDVDAIIFDPNLAPLDKLFDLTQERYFDAIGYSVLNPTLRHDIEILCKLAESAAHGLRLIGGIAASNMRPEDIFKALPVDLIVKGAGENPLTMIMEKQAGSPAKGLDRFLGIPGVSVAGREETYGSAPALLSRSEFAFSATADVENVPYSTATYDVINGGGSYWGQTLRSREEREGVIPLNEIGSRSIRIETADFCRGRCVFCSVRSYEKRLTTDGYVKVQLTPEEMVSLIELAQKHHKFDSIHWDDDDFLNEPERIRVFCKLVIEKGLNRYPMLIKARADEIDRDLLKLMKEAGIKIIAIGVEDLSENLQRLGKGIDPEKVERVVNLIIDEGLICGMNEIVFSHTSTPETIAENIRRSVAILKRGNSYLGAIPRMEAYWGAPIMRYKNGNLIQFEELMLPGMKASLKIPTVVRFEDPAMEELFDKAVAERDRFLLSLSSDPSYEFNHFPFPVLSLALFRGVYVALNRPPHEIKEIEELIFAFVNNSKSRPLS